MAAQFAPMEPLLSLFLRYLLNFKHNHQRLDSPAACGFHVLSEQTNHVSYSSKIFLFFCTMLYIDKWKQTWWQSRSRHPNISHEKAAAVIISIPRAFTPRTRRFFCLNLYLWLTAAPQPDTLFSSLQLLSLLNVFSNVYNLTSDKKNWKCFD